MAASDVSDMFTQSSYFHSFIGQVSEKRDWRFSCLHNQLSSFSSLSTACKTLPQKCEQNPFYSSVAIKGSWTKSKYSALTRNS